ncbi:methyltransferase domain-containing protein [Chloroflexi bacterium TSY]|nr:methyltransferase domain-containing protein [Chloroflexi bacterium TSY]
MELRLATILSRTDAKCQVQLLDNHALEGNSVLDHLAVEAVYAQPLIEYGISIKPQDLVVVDSQTKPIRVVWRAEWVKIVRLEQEVAFIDDGVSQSRTIPCPEALASTLAVGDAIYIVENRFIAYATPDGPADPDRICDLQFPAIEAMYQSLGADRPWMKTFLQMENARTTELPPEFQQDDVRYPESLVEYFLRQFTHKGDIVFDPFAGYGTTLVAAETLDRIPYGIEFDAARADYVRSRLRQPDNLIHGDSRKLATYELPLFDFVMTSPPYMGKSDPEDPFTNYASEGDGYEAYLRDLQRIFAQVKDYMKPGAKAVVEVANLKRSDDVTMLAWDIARSLAEVLHFEGEIVVGWDLYGYGYDHSYCLVFSKPKLSFDTNSPKEIVAQGYDQILDRYLEWSEEFDDEERARCLSILTETLNDRSEVLELGCATGAVITEQLAEHYQVTGVDISAKQIDRARERIPNARFIHADMTQLDFPPNCFDAVVALFSIIHVPRQEEPILLSKIASWLRPGGLFVASLGANASEGGYEEDWLGAPMYWSHYDSATNVRLIEAADLEIVLAQEETQEEFGEAVTFLWIVARKPSGSSK